MPQTAVNLEFGFRRGEALGSSALSTPHATAAEEVVYELVAEPQEPPEQSRQEERSENLAQGPVHPSSEQQPEGKPRCITPYLNYSLYLIK